MEKLVKKAKKGDAEAFIALMEQNRQSMIRIAFAYLGNEEDVADAMQESILSAFEKLDTLRRAEYFRTWLIPYSDQPMYCNETAQESDGSHERGGGSFTVL